MQTALCSYIGLQQRCFLYSKFNDIRLKCKRIQHICGRTYIADTDASVCFDARTVFSRCLCFLYKPGKVRSVKVQPEDTMFRSDKSADLNKRIVLQIDIIIK